VWAGIGAMVKYFPVLVLLPVWRFRRDWRQAMTYAVTVGAVCAAVIVPFLVASPSYAMASLRAQLSKTSWQTVWALADCNLGTGIFGPVEAHLDPAKAVASQSNLPRISLDECLAARTSEDQWIPQGYPPRIPPLITLFAFGILYLWIWANLKSQASHQHFMAFTAATFVVFFLWSKGWSPQWLVMLIPFLLMTLPLGRALLYILTLTFVNLAEWPVLLSRGMNQYLYLTVPLRTVLFVLLLVELIRVMMGKQVESMTGRQP
jgi:hypothetical protein